MGHLKKMIINLTRAEKELIQYLSDRQSGEIDHPTAFHLSLSKTLYSNSSLMAMSIFCFYNFGQKHKKPD